MNPINTSKQTIYITNKHTHTASDLARLPIEIVDRDGDHLKLRYNGQIYHALIKNFDFNNSTKSAKINIDGYDHEVTIKEPIDQLVEELGFLTKAKQSVKEVKSMMPGLVVNIFVSVGDEVQDGEKLLSLEAMKMENIIKSPGAGIVKEIHVSAKQAIEKNQLLISFE